VVRGPDPTFFPGRCAEVVWRGVPLGRFGVVHPEVSRNFELTGVVTALELRLQPFV
jgi:phenylalanyl-tRNA synthetase beta chain